MDKFFKIVGIIVVLWILFGFVGWLLGFLIKTIFWIAVIAGVAYVVATLVVKKNQTKR